MFQIYAFSILIVFSSYHTMLSHIAYCCCILHIYLYYIRHSYYFINYNTSFKKIMRTNVHSSPPPQNIRPAKDIHNYLDLEQNEITPI